MNWAEINSFYFSTDWAHFVFPFISHNWAYSQLGRSLNATFNMGR